MSAEAVGSGAQRTRSVRYGAFRSQRHAANTEVARGLQKWLQTYAKPWWRWRAISVFRDETDLTAAPASAPCSMKSASIRTGPLRPSAPPACRSPSFAELVKLAEAGDIAGLRAYGIRVFYTGAQALD